MPQGCGTKASPAVSEANAAKLLALQAAVATCQNAMLTHGGYGYAKEYHVERFMRAVMVLCPDHLASCPTSPRRDSACRSRIEGTARRGGRRDFRGIPQFRIAKLNS
ncbi:acyl-CoA dehydrogenase family protein [Paracoccus versutus]